MALVKGRSDNPELDTMAGCIHAPLYSLRSGCYFEWVQSADNWSDGISRPGIHDEWYQAHGFRVHRVPVPPFFFCEYHPYKSCLPVLLSALGMLECIGTNTWQRYAPGVHAAWAAVTGSH